LGYARGLTQTIPATFARFHQPGTSTDIYDPVANICASMNYVMHRYGVRLDGSNLVASVQQADARRPPRGY
jgi:SLT domain-containing protein